MIFELAMLSGVSFVAALVLTPLLRDAFLHLKILDAPDGVRKLHKTAVPRVGGIPIAISYLMGLALLPIVHGRGVPWRDDHTLTAGLIVAAGVVLLTGILDDVVGLKPWQKLAGQMAAALLLCLAGVRISSFGGHPLSAWIGVPLTLGWLAMCTNAFNLIDGLDGLASGMGLFATLTMFIAALLTNSDNLALVTLPLAGSLLGFLRYNFNPASVFLGDSGSLLVGFLLGSYAVIWSQKSATLLGLTAPLMALAVPLLDVCLSVCRRWLRGQPIFGADRSHIHHKLLDRGLTHRSAVLILYAAGGLCAAFSLVQSVAPVRFAGLIIIMFCGVTWVGVQHLGYSEFDSARRALKASSLRRSIRGEMAIHATERRINEATSIEACWEAVRDASHQLGFSQIEATLAGRTFQDRVVKGDSCTSWQLRVQLGGDGYIQVGRDLFAGPEPAGLVPSVDMLRYKLLPKLATIRQFEPEHTGTVGLLNLAEQLKRENVRKEDPVRL